MKYSYSKKKNTLSQPAISKINRDVTVVILTNFPPVKKLSGKKVATAGTACAKKCIYYCGSCYV